MDNKPSGPILNGRVLFDYAAQAANQMSLKKGSIIQITMKGQAGGWSKGLDNTGKFLLYINLFIFD